MTAGGRVGAPAAGRSFRHGALLYRNRRDFLDGTLSYIRAGLVGAEPTLVIVDPDKIAELRAELGDDADRVRFADMAVEGRNPARIIHRWRRFVQEHAGPDRPVRGVGEPVWAGRSPSELVECQAHETLLNVAFAEGPAWSLLCPYDVSALAPDVVEEARRSHPYLVCDGAERVSDGYVEDHPSPARRDRPLPPPPGHAELARFGPGTDSLRGLRAFLRQRAERAGLDPGTVERLLLAANEVATNSISHGGGQGTVRLWGEDGMLVCQVDDAGRIEGQPLLGRYPAAPDQPGGRGLWLANQLCDLVQIRSGEAGTTVRLHLTAQRRPAAAARAPEPPAGSRDRA